MPGRLGAPGADFGPVAFERTFGHREMAQGSALCSDAVGAGARSRKGDLGGAGDQAESLILAQNERWRRA
jgi:hypothetical protein